LSGCILFQFYTGWTPFPGETEYLIFTKSVTGELIFPNIIPPDAEDLIRAMIKINPEERIPLQEVEKHDFFKCLKSWNSNDSENNEALTEDDPIDNKNKIPKKGICKLSDIALISLKNNYIKNSSLLKLRPLEVEAEVNKMEECIVSSKIQLSQQKAVWVEERISFFIKQFRALINEQIIEF
jgi:serine/threonine protein kinase